MGRYYPDGIRALLQRVSEAVHAVGPAPVQRMTISESQSEATLGSLTANLAIYGWMTCGFVPAWQSVYGGYTLNVGLGTAWPGFFVNLTDPAAVNRTCPHGYVLPVGPQDCEYSTHPPTHTTPGAQNLILPGLRIPSCRLLMNVSAAHNYLTHRH